MEICYENIIYSQINILIYSNIAWVSKSYFDLLFLVPYFCTCSQKGEQNMFNN